MQTPFDTDQSSWALSAALRIVDDAWTEIQRGPYVQAWSGIPVTRLPDVSFEEAERRSRVGHSILKRLNELEEIALPHDLELTLRLVRFRAASWSRQADWYWLVFEPLGIGTFGLFLPTAYAGGWLLGIIKGQLAAFKFTESGDTDRYLGLVSDYARLVEQFAERSAGQAQRGIRMAKPQVWQARRLLSQLKTDARAAIEVAPERLGSLPGRGFAQELDKRIVTRIEPTFEHALNILSESYLERAPENGGLGQYSGGAEIYADLVRQHTTLSLTPEQVHAEGLERMDEIEGSIRAIQSELGFDGDSAGFLTHMNQNPAWRATSVREVATFFQRYIDRLRPHLSRYFFFLPNAPYGTAALPETLQGSMTYGYYDPPRSYRPKGLYLFNARNLTHQPLFQLAALTYHELMPGHHMHLSMQQENHNLHPLRAYSFVLAYIEGWAEYAATLAGEIGVYEQPEERYGRLAMDAFQTSRLVVDTGMNALGWSRERAREYMREHSRITAAEIETETLRYSCDIPGQSLAYSLGNSMLLKLRERMRQELGPNFNIKDFHAAVLRPGALPLGDLEWHVNYETHRLKSS